EREPAGSQPREAGHDPLQPLRPHDGQRVRAAEEGERGEEAGQPEEVVAVEVGDEDGVEAGAVEAGGDEPELRPLAAVEQEERPLAADGRAGGAALPRGDGAAGAEGDGLKRGGSEKGEVKSEKGLMSLCPFAAFDILLSIHNHRQVIILPITQSALLFTFPFSLLTFHFL